MLPTDLHSVMRLGWSGKRANEQVYSRGPDGQTETVSVCLTFIYLKSLGKNLAFCALHCKTMVVIMRKSRKFSGNEKQRPSDGM